MIESNEKNMKQKTLIAIMGLHDQGKTTTMNLMVGKLKKLSGASSVTLPQKENIATFLIQIGNITIGVIDSDHPYLVVNAIKDFVKVRECNIIVCRSCFLQRTTTVNTYIDSRALSAYRVLKTTNYSIANKKPQPLHDILNEHSANQLVDTIKGIMSGTI